MWFARDRGQWIIISYLFVLDFTTGATMRTSFFRVIGTVVGCGVGLLVRFLAAS